MKAESAIMKGRIILQLPEILQKRTTLMAKRNRMRWTQELHDQFIECVNRLGGAKSKLPNRTYHFYFMSPELTFIV